MIDMMSRMGLHYAMSVIINFILNMVKEIIQNLKLNLLLINKEKRYAELTGIKLLEP